MSFNKTESFQLTGDVARSATLAQNGDNEDKSYINFSASGQLIVPLSGTNYPPLTKLMGFGMQFPGVGTSVTVKYWSSGGYLSGLVQSTLTFNSGMQELSWVASGPSPTPPIVTTSGTVAAISFQNNYLASGQNSSGAHAYSFVN